MSIRAHNDGETVTVHTNEILHLGCFSIGGHIFSNFRVNVKKNLVNFFFPSTDGARTAHEQPLIFRRKHVDNRASFPYQTTATLLEKRFLQREHRGLFLIAGKSKFISDSNLMGWGALPRWHAFCRYAICFFGEKWAMGLEGDEDWGEGLARTESIYEGRWSQKESNSRVNRNLSV